MKQEPGFSNRIIRLYLIGASILLAFYMFAFHAGVLSTENTVVERRINIVAPFHFKRFESGQQGVIKIDPLLTLYETHTLLPTYIKSKVPRTWTGSVQLLFDNDREFQLVAQEIEVQGLPKVVYAVENADTVEWDDTKFVIIELSLAFTGVLLFLITTAYMVRAAKRIASPFLQVAEKLTSDSLSNFEQIKTSGEKSKELLQILTALNAYRRRLAIQIDREQSFTRYVSHELRTPMMIIKGAISNLRQDAQYSNNKAVDKIAKATDQMQELTQTFLMLAREQDLETEQTCIDESFLQLISTELEDMVSANQIDFQWQLDASFVLSASPQLTKAVIHNLLKNAFSCSLNGSVTLLVCEQQIKVIDNGVGLNAKPRGYEGFGIGLILVKDICEKYAWQFSLVNNPDKGCSATVDFAPSTKLTADKTHFQKG